MMELVLGRCVWGGVGWGGVASLGGTGEGSEEQALGAWETCRVWVEDEKEDSAWLGSLLAAGQASPPGYALGDGLAAGPGGGGCDRGGARGKGFASDRELAVFGAEEGEDVEEWRGGGVWFCWGQEGGEIEGRDGDGGTWDLCESRGKWGGWSGIEGRAVITGVAAVIAALAGLIFLRCAGRSGIGFWRLQSFAEGG
jgi:hypothetical protein